MSEFTSHHTSEELFGQELATPAEIAQNFALWSDLETDVRARKRHIFDADTEILPSLLRITTGLPRRPKTSLEISRINTEDDFATPEVRVVFRNFTVGSGHRSYRLYRWELTADGADSVYEELDSSNVSIPQEDEPQASHTVDRLIEPAPLLTKQGLGVLDQLYSEINQHTEMPTQEAKPTSQKPISKWLGLLGVQRGVQNVHKIVDK